jgi:hypothetical protein
MRQEDWERSRDEWERRLAHAATHVDADCPYVLDGRDYKPKWIPMVMLTRDEVAHALTSVARWRGRTIDEVAQTAGVPVGRAERLASEGRGRIDDLLALCSELKIVVTRVPHPVVLAGGKGDDDEDV